MQTSRAALGVPAPGNDALVSLPPPQQKVVAAVYKFRDQTGQYKPSATGAAGLQLLLRAQPPSCLNL
ncbi:CsgG/HfaB family protein [Pontibacter rugosus]